MKKDNLVKIINKGLEWSVYIMLLSIPLSKSLIEISVSIGIILFILKRTLTGNFKFPATSGNMPLLFVFLTALLSLVNSQYMNLSVRALFSKNIKFIAMYFLVIEAIDTREKIMNLLKLGLLSVIIVLIDGFVQHFITRFDLFHNYIEFKYMFDYDKVRKIVHYSALGYPTGPFPYPNDLSAWLLIMIPAMLFIALFDLKGKRYKYLMLFLSAAGLYLFVLAKVRSAWISFILAIGSLIFLARRAAVMVLATMLLLVLITFAKYPNNFLFGLSSMQDRGDMWSNGVKIFKEHPIVGNGINTFFNKYREVRNDESKGLRGSYAHNCYLQMAADTGILGLAAFLWFIAAVFVNVKIRLKAAEEPFLRFLAMGLLAGISAFLTHSFFDTNLYSLNLASFFWIATGFLVAVINIAALKKS